MSSFVPSQGSGLPAPAPNGPASGQMSEKPPPVPWQQLASTFETTSTRKPSVPSVPLIRANTTLEQDKETVLRCWSAMGGKEDVLRRKYHNVYYDYEDEDDDEEEYLMRDEPSDVVSEWFGVRVEGGRVTRLDWDEYTICFYLTGTIPAEIGALSALTILYLNGNQLNGAIPPTIGALSSLTHLHLDYNSLSGVIPYSLCNLPNLESLHLSDNNLSANPGNLYTRPGVQDFLLSYFRHSTIRLLDYGIAITNKRQEVVPSTTTTATTDAFHTITTTINKISAFAAAKPAHPFFALLALCTTGARAGWSRRALALAVTF